MHHFEPYKGVKMVMNYMSIVRSRELWLHSTETTVTPPNYVLLQIYSLGLYCVQQLKL